MCFFILHISASKRLHILLLPTFFLPLFSSLHCSPIVFFLLEKCAKSSGYFLSTYLIFLSSLWKRIQRNFSIYSSFAFSFSASQIFSFSRANNLLLNSEFDPFSIFYLCGSFLPFICSHFFGVKSLSNLKYLLLISLQYFVLYPYSTSLLWNMLYLLVSFTKSKIQPSFYLSQAFMTIFFATLF